ncbi:hypothetical protein EUTSA_v10015996mg [Eutrema salsugineum]|uniref:Uncharacterized protein n=1 Tax=Eutrema salsugineum TaxID=72664 RepID=V4LG73_EUTSA|nr:hypothetical protein EUTSA_v10015996mg [Eutrema salsugineum]
MEIKDARALQIIQNGLTEEILPWIASATSSKEAWELLLVKSIGGPMFQAKKLIDLKKEYENMKMSDTETVHGFTGKLMELVFRMKFCGWEVEDKEVVKKIISSLPPRFDQVLVKVVERLSICELIDYLLVNEYKTKPVQESLEESVITESVVGVEESLQQEHESLNSLRERVNSSMERVDSSIERVNTSIERVSTSIERVSILIKRVDSSIERVNSMREILNSSDEVIPVRVAALKALYRRELFGFGIAWLLTLCWALCVAKILPSDDY